MECSFSFNELDFILSLSFAVQAMNHCRGTSSFVFKGAASSVDWASGRLFSLAESNSQNFCQRRERKKYIFILSEKMVYKDEE